MKRPKESDNYISNLIRNTRKSIGMSQMDLAIKLKVSYQQVQKYENGKSQLTIPRMKQMATALGIRPQDFLRTADFMEEASCASLSKKEVRLVGLFRQASGETTKDGILKLMEGLVDLKAAKRN